MTERRDMHQPLVSIIITSYNRSHWISQAIDSALAQDYPNIEVVISDNCSTDGTDALMQTYSRDRRCKYFRNSENIGMINNFYKSYLELANGKYIMHVSSDDHLCNPSFVTKAVAVFEQHPTVEIVSAASIILDDTTGEKYFCEGYEYYRNSFFKDGFVDGKTCFLSFAQMHAISLGACLIRTESFRKKVTVDRQLSNSGDIQILLQLLLEGDAWFIDEPAYVFRVHGGQASGSYETAGKFIDNFRFVTVPYERALEKKSFAEDVLQKWKSDMIFPHLRYGFHLLLKKSKAEFRKIKTYADAEYPELSKRIQKEPKFILKRILNLTF